MPVPCARCVIPLPVSQLAANNRGSATAACALCGAVNMTRVFPALLAERVAAHPEPAVDGEASCFDHPVKRAVAACQQCGRFVCHLCAVSLTGVTWCPSCVTAGVGKARLANPDSERMLFDSIALTLPLVSLLVWPLTIIAAPASLVLSIAKWREPLSIVRHSRWRFVVAILLSICEILLWALLLFGFFMGLRHLRAVPQQ